VKLPDLLVDRLLLAGIAELGSAFDTLDEARLKWSAGLALTGDTFLGDLHGRGGRETTGPTAGT